MEVGCKKNRMFYFSLHKMQDFYQLTNAEKDIPKFYIGKPPKEEAVQEENEPLF